MNKKYKVISMFMLILIGITLIGFGIFSDFWGGENVNKSGMMLGLGAGLIGAAIAQLATIRIYIKNPRLLHKKTIEVTDERNTTIRKRAKSKVYDIFNLVFPVMIFGLVFANVSFVITGILLGIYGFRTILLIVYLIKYNKEM